MNPQQDCSRRRFLGGVALAGASGLLALSPEGQGQSEGKQNPWQIGCYTRPWDTQDYRVALDAIAEAGYKYVGLMTTQSKTRLVISIETTIEEAAKVGQECKQRGLTAASAYGGDIPVAESLERGVEGLKRLIDCCEAAQVANLMMGGIGDEKLYEPYFKAIGQCGGYAAGKGIGISMKPHGGLNATGPQCRKAVEFAGHENFRIWYDPGNIFYYSDGALDPLEDAPTVNGLVAGISVKDYQHPKQVLVTPGTGQVNFPGVLAKLKEGGFTSGPLIVECLKPGDLPHTLEEAKKARKFVEDLVA
jgi:sugar phosphate isomerase/epimerase